VSLILGISCFYHDSAAALIKDDEIIYASQEERFSRKKHDASFPDKSIKYILSKYKLKFSDCFVVGFSQGGMMTFELGNYSEEQLGGLAILSGRIMTNEPPTNLKFLKTPLFISHGDNDDVLNIDNFYSSCNYLKENNFHFEKHLLEGDSHTISPKAINLLQKFKKKNL